MLGRLVNDAATRASLYGASHLELSISRRTSSQAVICRTKPLGGFKSEGKYWKQQQDVGEDHEGYGDVFQNRGRGRTNHEHCPRNEVGKVSDQDQIYTSS